MAVHEAEQGLFQLPTLHLPYDDCRSPLISPLLPTDSERPRRLLLKLRQQLSQPVDGELLALIEEACDALSASGQEVALLAAAQPCELDGAPHERDAWQDAVASKRLALGDAAGDETLTPTMLVPLLRRASLLKDAALSAAMLDALGVLTASLSGHGEHTLRVGLHPAEAAAAPLLLRYRPLGLGTGLRLWPVARLAIGACAAQWAGLRVAGKSVLELGCGCGAVGLACAALGARSVWLTDIDEAALALAARNAALNGLEGTARAARLDFLAAEAGGEEAATPARPPGMPATFELVVAADILYDWSESRWRDALGAMARYLGTGADARVLCCFGSGSRSGAARRSVEALERAVGRGDTAGLRCVASEEVPPEGPNEGLLMLLLART